MGGAAFAADGFYTPRIPSEIYEKVLQDIESKLAPLYESAVHAIPAPEKPDHGDIDILAAPLPDKQPQPAEIAKIIGAKNFYTASSANEVMNFAIPWPTNSNQSSDTDKPERFIQVDLTVCSSAADLSWRLFAFGHGDLLNILSKMIYPKGLTLSSQALWLRIPNLDTRNKRNTRIELSKDPKQVMTFLGLNPARFYTPFLTREEMMVYIATCRFYDPARIYQYTETKRNAGRDGSPAPKERSQLESRPLFRYWTESFIPAHRDDPPCESAQMTRTEVEEEAFKFFGGDTRQRYDTVKHEIGTMLAREKLWVGIKADVAKKNPKITETELHDTLRAVRREIIAPGNSKPTDPNLSDVQRAYLELNWTTVHEWAIENYAAALARWRELVARSRMPPTTDTKKTNKYSTSEVESYTEVDDSVILQMKSEGASWTDILGVLGKKSKSQLQAYWKSDLQQG